MSRPLPVAPPPRWWRLPSPPRRPKVSRAPLRPAGAVWRRGRRRYRRLRRLRRGAWSAWMTPVDPVPHRDRRCRASRSAPLRRAGERPGGRRRTGRDGRRPVGDRPPEPGIRTELGVAGCHGGRARCRWGWGTDRYLGRNRKLPAGDGADPGEGSVGRGEVVSGPGRNRNPSTVGVVEPVGAGNCGWPGRSVPRGGR